MTPRPKKKPLRSKDYLAYIRTLPCDGCGTDQGVQAHHISRAGMGLKCDDFMTVPTCRKCHGEIHSGRRNVSYVIEELCYTPHKKALYHLIDWLRTKDEGTF